MESGSRRPIPLWRACLRLARTLLLVNAIGIGVALGVWAYSRELELLGSLRLQLAAWLPRAVALPLVGLCGGGVAGGLISWVEPAAAGSGILPVLLHLRGVAVPMGWRVALVKLLASGIAIGSGIPVGPEGPAIQIGASVARESADALGGSGEAVRRRHLAVAIGGGAGLAAIFHAPLGALAYILEELLRRANLRVNAIAAFATFATVAWTRLLNEPGGGPLPLRNLQPIVSFPSPIDELRLADLPLLLLLGAVAGLLAVLYQGRVLRLRRALAGRRIPAWQLLPLLGLAVGLGWSLLPVRFDDPERLGFDALLGLDRSGDALLALVVQAAGTGLAVAADAPGGFLAPALVVGASLGALLQQLGQQLVHYAPATLLFAGGGAFLGALTRTPLTAILLGFELSKNYAMLLPIGFCVLTAIAVADLLERRGLIEVMLAEALAAETRAAEALGPEPGGTEG